MEDQDLELVAKLKQFGLDVSYMLLQLRKRVDKNIKHLNNNLDSQIFCTGLTEVFNELSSNNVLFCKNLAEKIIENGKKDDYKEIILRLQRLSGGPAESTSCSCSSIKSQDKNSVGGVDTFSINKDVPLTGSTVPIDRVPNLSQTSIHIEDELKEEPATQPSNNAAIYQPGSCHSTDESTSTVIYECNSPELLRRENKKSTSDSDKTSDKTDIFDQPTVPNSPVSNIEDHDNLANLNEDVASRLEDVTEIQNDCQENSQHSSSARSSKGKLSSIDESDDSYVEIIQNDKSAEKDLNDEGMINKENCDTDSTMENLPNNDDRASQGSDLTVDNLSPSSDRICDQNIEQNSIEPSQQFELSTEGIFEAETENTVITEKDSTQIPKENTVCIFDAATQALMPDKTKLSIDAENEQTVDELSTQDRSGSNFDGATEKSTNLNNLNQNASSSESLSSEPVFVSEADFDCFTQDVVANIRPKSKCDETGNKENRRNSNHNDDIFSAETQAVATTETFSNIFNAETQICVSKPDNHVAPTGISITSDNDANLPSCITSLDAGDGNKSENCGNEDDAAPDYGDVSGSDSSDGITVNSSKPKKKLKDEDRKSLLKVIKQYYTKRKNERLRQSANVEDSHSSSDEATVKKPVRKSPKKRDRKSSKGSEKKSTEVRKSLLNEDSTSNLPKDNLNIEDHSEDTDGIHEAATQKVDIKKLNELSRQEAEKCNESDDNIISRKRKSVRPLSDSTAESEGIHNSDDSDVVSPFKRKSVQPLKPSQSDLDQENSDQTDKRVAKRLLSDSEPKEANGASKDSDSDKSNTHPAKKLKVAGSNSEGSGLDDSARNAFLSMLEEHENFNHPASESDLSVVGGQQKDKNNDSLSQFKLGDNDRDSLLNMLTEKEQDDIEKVVQSDEDKENTDIKSKFDEITDSYLIDDCSSNSDQSNQTYKIIDDFLSDSNDPQTSKKKHSSKKSFKLDETEKDELVKILSDHLKENDTDSSKESLGSEDEDKAEVGQKRKSSKDFNGKDQKRKKKEKIDREQLLDLVENFEKAANKETGLLIDQLLPNETNYKSNQTTGMCLMDRNSDGLGPEAESDADSVLLEVLREETVEQEKSDGLGAWDIYKKMTFDDDGNFDLSESDIAEGDISETDIEALGLSEQEVKKSKEQNIDLRKFGLDKELIVKITREDFSRFDDFGKLNRRRSRVKEKTKKDIVHSLLDFQNLKKKRDHKKETKLNRSSRSRSTSSDHSSSSESGTDNSLVQTKAKSNSRRRKDSLVSELSWSYDENSTDINLNSPSRASPLVHFISDNEDRFNMAQALMDNIRDSSEERGSPYSDNSVSSDDSRKRAARRRKEKKEAEKLKRAEESGQETDKSVERANSSDQKEETAADKAIALDSSDQEHFVAVRKSVSAWRRDPLLTGKFFNSSSTSGSEDEAAPKKKSIRQRRFRRRNSSSSGDEWQREPKVPKKKFIFSDLSETSESENDVEIVKKETTPQKPILITDDEDTPSKRGKGRRNIRALLEEDDLAEATQRAHNEEKERIKRLQERDKAKESFTQSFSSQPLSEDEANPLILDVADDVTIKIHPKITQRLKPHQRDGIQFMWDSCYESVTQLKNNYKGSGCILAHCMGLGKTLQALALIQTLFAYEDLTKTKHVLVVCPLSTVSNWRNEYKLAYKHIRDSKVKLYTIENIKAAQQRFGIIRKWHRTGGVLVLGYECFGLCVNEQKLEKLQKNCLLEKDKILEALVDPGPDLIICDEGHLLRNKQSQRTLALNKVKTRRRIILTGTPLQNNLLEYYYMVNFVKPDLLGTEKEYKINFVNPINNGQFEDSTAGDIMFMKKRTHVLHKILTNTVQRVEDTELKQYLPKLIDQAVFINLSDLQVKLYNTYLDFVNTKPVTLTKAGNVSHKNFLADVQILMYICSHPNLIITAEKNHKAKIKEQDVIDEIMDEAVDQKVFSRAGWYKGLLSPSGVKELELGSKMKVALSIVEEAIKNKDKVLIFAQSYAEMDTLEHFFAENLKFKKNKDYYRMDGTISPEVRTSMCDKFNDKKNDNIKVFIMSIKVGGLGLNLTAANRVILMNVSWNPSYDTQSVFRAFRFGQTKAVFVYRLITLDTVEEKIYQRGVTKLAVAHRVVDKHQITRHYNAADIQEFYAARPTTQKDRPLPNVPEDRVLANLVLKHQIVYKWHEHQDLLANRPEEELDEQEKNAAWEEYNQKEVLQPPQHFPHNSSNMGQPGPSGIRPQYPFMGHHFPQLNIPQPNNSNPNGLRRNPRRIQRVIIDELYLNAQAAIESNKRRRKKLSDADILVPYELKNLGLLEPEIVLETPKETDEIVDLVNEGDGGTETTSSQDVWINDGMDETLMSIEIHDSDSEYLAKPGGFTYNPDHSYSSPKNMSHILPPGITPNIPKMVPRPLFADGKQGSNPVVPPQVPTPQASTSVSLTPINTVKMSNAIQANNNINTPNTSGSEKPRGVDRVDANQHNWQRQTPKNPKLIQKLATPNITQHKNQNNNYTTNNLPNHQNSSGSDQPKILGRIGTNTQTAVRQGPKPGWNSAAPNVTQFQHNLNNVQKQLSSNVSENYNGAGRVGVNPQNLLSRQISKNTSGLNPTTPSPIQKRLDPEVKRILDKQIRDAVEWSRQEQIKKQSLKPGELLQDSQNYISLPIVRPLESMNNDTSPKTFTSSTAPKQQQSNKVSTLVTPKVTPVMPTPRLLLPSMRPLVPAPRNKLLIRKQVVAPPPKPVLTSLTSTSPRVTPVKIHATSAPSTAVVDLSSDSPQSTNKQAPQSPVLQQQVRQLMHHLHELQKSHAVGGQVNVPASTSVNPTNGASPRAYTAAATRITNTKNLPEIGGKTTLKKPLVAARNLTDFRQGDSVSPRTNNYGSKPPVVRLINSGPSTSKNATPLMGKSPVSINSRPITNIRKVNPNNKQQQSSNVANTPKRLLQMPAGNKIVVSSKTPPSQSLEHVPKLPVRNVPRSTGNNGAVRNLTPTGWIGNGPKNPPTNQISPVRIKQKNLSKSTSNLSKQSPIQSRVTKVVVSPKWAQAVNKPNVPPSRANSLPTMVVPQATYSRLDKENRTKRRPSIKGNPISASIDLCIDDPLERKHPLSPQMVKTLKEKGVSIKNIEDQDVIKLD